MFQWKLNGLQGSSSFLGAKAPLKPASSEGLYVCMYVCIYVCNTLGIIKYTRIFQPHNQLPTSTWESARWHARTNLTPSMYCVDIWLRARQIGLSTWVKPYKSDSEQFCLSYNHMKYELKHFLTFCINAISLGATLYDV